MTSSGAVPPVLLAAAAAAAGAAVLVHGGVPGRRLRGLSAAAARPGRGVPRDGGGAADGRRRHGRAGAVDVAELADRLAALVRAGLPPGRAWVLLAATPGPAQATCARVAGQLAAGGRAADGLRVAPGPPPLRWLAVACDSADRAGSPLGDVLAGFAAGLRADEQAAADRAAAMAGPRATATVLSLLPLAGGGLGFLLGADPVATLLGTAPGRLVLLAGLGSWVSGQWWIRVLVARAERAGR